MTDRSKFEQMLEYLISEEQDKAREVFHQLVVEKSREIYESILAEELKDENDEEVDEGMQVTFSETDDEEDMGEMDPLGGPDDGEVGGDATDDFLGDIDADAGGEGEDEMDMDMDGGEGEGELEDRVMDLEDALDDLRAEFEQMMGDEGSDDMGADDEGSEEEPDFGSEEEPAGEEGEEADDEEEKEVKDSFDATAFMREYIEKVSTGHGAEKKSTGDNGSNTKSVIDNMKNDMGGTTANFARGGEAGGKGVESGLAKPTPKEENFGNINVPGGKAGKTAFKKREPGHGAERKGSGDNGDKSAGSPINGAPKRAR